MNQTASLSIRRIQNLFSLLGWIGLIAGLFILSYSWLGLRPRLASLTDQLHSDLADLHSTTEQFNDANSPTIQLIHTVPNLVVTLHGTLMTSSQALYGTAKTTNDAKKGITGLVMPKDALGIDTNRLSQAGHQLGLLGDVIGRMEAPSQQLAGDVKSVQAHLGELSTRLGNLSDAFDHAAIPFHSALLGSAIALLCIFFGSLCLVLAEATELFASGRVAEVDDARSKQTHVLKVVGD